MTFKEFLLLAGLSISEERACLQESLYFESRSEPYAGQVAVGLVIKHRVLSEDFPNSVCRVISQPHQFSYKTGSLHQGDKESSEKAFEVADTVLQSNSTPSWSDEELPLYFHTVQIKPWWAKSMEKKFTIGQHIFYSGGKE